MSAPQPQPAQQQPFAPSRAARLVCWLAIYIGASCLWEFGRAVRIFPGYNPVYACFDRVSYAFVHFPENVQLLIVGSFGVPYDSFFSHTSLALAYSLFVFDLVLCLRCPRQKSFVILIGLLVALVILGWFASSYYVGIDEIVHRHP